MKDAVRPTKHSRSRDSSATRRTYDDAWTSVAGTRSFTVEKTTCARARSGNNTEQSPFLRLAGQQQRTTSAQNTSNKHQSEEEKNKNNSRPTCFTQPWCQRCRWCQTARVQKFIV